MEGEAVLRKLLLVAFLSVVSTNIPAYAVDYIACREMLRTKNEFVSISNLFEKSVIKTQGIYNTKKGISDWEECVISSYRMSERFSLPFICVCCNDISKKKDIKRNTKDTIDKGFHFITDEGHYYYKKALKVEADMKRANCPY